MKHVPFNKRPHTRYGQPSEDQRAMVFRAAGQSFRVNVPNWVSLEARVAERLAQRQGFAIATLNLDHLVKLRTSPTFRSAYAAQDFVTADGNPVVWMSKIAGRPVGLVPGSDAVLPLARVAARQGVPIALIGSTDATLRQTKTVLEREIRDVTVTFLEAPPMGFDPLGSDSEALMRRLDASDARLCFLAMGAPKQELMAALGRKLAPEVGFVSIGAGLDFIAGTQTRAPEWVRRYAIEWLWRAVGDPRRLAKRYLLCMLVLPGFVVQSLLLRVRPNRKPGSTLRI